MRFECTVLQFSALELQGHNSQPNPSQMLVTDPMYVAWSYVKYVYICMLSGRGQI